jgi:molybdenum cofactor guanylyltransferase
VYDPEMEGAPADDITAFILAGGNSTRMGADKAFVTFDGRTLLARATELMYSVTSNVRIVGNLEKFAVFAPVVEDIYRKCGPLGGIHAALRASQSELNLMLAVDMPFVSKFFLRYLLEQARVSSDAVVVLPYSGGRRQPLCAVYRREFAEVAEHSLRAGRNRIDILFDTLPTRVLEEEELKSAGFSPAIFRNLNTPEDVDAAKRMA